MRRPKRKLGRRSGRTGRQSYANGGKVSFREGKRAERIEDIDRAPDFIVSDEFNPFASIEAVPAMGEDS